MKYQVGDLFITKSYSTGKKQPAFVVEVHNIDLEECWVQQSVTYQYLESGAKVRNTIYALEMMLNEPSKKYRWIHIPVKT
jgi:hypothetical protein